MIKTTYAPERAVYTLEDGMESAGTLTLIAGPAEYIRLDLHEAAIAAARAEGIPQEVRAALVDAQELAHGLSFSKDKMIAEWARRVEGVVMAAWEA